jgi:hypothetical protein
VSCPLLPLKMNVLQCSLLSPEFEANIERRLNGAEAVDGIGDKVGNTKHLFRWIGKWKLEYCRAHVTMF